MNLSVQAQCDVDELVCAYYHGGKRLATLTWRAMVDARKLKVWEVAVIGDKVRAELARHGYLPIVP